MRIFMLGMSLWFFLKELLVTERDFKPMMTLGGDGKAEPIHAEFLKEEQEYQNNMSQNFEPPPWNTTELRSNLLWLLNSLPNNTTQKVLGFAVNRTYEGGNITLATQGGISKLMRLPDLASRWLGPVSCAIVITTKAQLDEWLDFLTEDYQTTKTKHISKYFTFHVLVEQPQLPLTRNRHPINQLRNLALENIETKFVFLNDVDFIPTANAHDLLLQQLQQRDLPPKVFWVLPAFERFGSEDLSLRDKGQMVTNVSLVPKRKTELIQMVRSKQVAPFHEYFKAGHGPTQYSQWYKATEMYNIRYAHLFEPYVVCQTVGLPEYFPTFRGYGYNKMVFSMEAYYRGFAFRVLPDLFVVHMNHPGRKHRKASEGDAHIVIQDFRKYLHQTYNVSKEDLSRWN